jgi:hypothetical protein
MDGVKIADSSRMMSAFRAIALAYDATSPRANDL